jgi:hypothetical protein
MSILPLHLCTVRMWKALPTFRRKMLSPSSRLIGMAWVFICAMKTRVGCTDTPIIVGRCPSLSAHESESMLRTYLVCRERWRERETSKRHVGEAHSVLSTAILQCVPLSGSPGKCWFTKRKKYNTFAFIPVMKRGYVFWEFAKMKLATRKDKMR